MNNRPTTKGGIEKKPKSCVTCYREHQPINEWNGLACNGPLHFETNSKGNICHVSDPNLAEYVVEPRCVIIEIKLVN